MLWRVALGYFKPLHLIKRNKFFVLPLVKEIISAFKKEHYQ